MAEKQNIDSQEDVDIEMEDVIAKIHSDGSITLEIVES